MVNMLSSDYRLYVATRFLFFWSLKIRKKKMLKRGVVFLCSGSFDSGDFKSKKNAHTKLQFERGNGHRLYKSVHDGKKKSNTHLVDFIYCSFS